MPKNTYYTSNTNKGTGIKLIPNSHLLQLKVTELLPTCYAIIRTVQKEWNTARKQETNKPSEWITVLWGINKYIIEVLELRKQLTKEADSTGRWLCGQKYAG